MFQPTRVKINESKIMDKYFDLRVKKAVEHDSDGYVVVGAFGIVSKSLKKKLEWKSKESRPFRLHYWFGI